MAHSVFSHGDVSRYCATVAQSLMLDVPPNIVWKEISDFVGLPRWVEGAKKTEFLFKVKRGIGAARKISFEDGSKVIEYAVGWSDGEYISYIATSGLPLDGYHATLSVFPKDGSSQVSWTSFLISNSPNMKQFEEFLTFIDSFYKNSLKNLKAKLEKPT